MLVLSSSQLGHSPFTAGHATLEEEGQRREDGFIDIDQKYLPVYQGDPSDSDPGYEVTNLIHEFKKAAYNIRIREGSSPLASSDPSL